MVDALASGLNVGLIYALLALGLAIVERSSSYFNMAHGAFAVFAAYIGLELATHTDSFAIAVAGALLAGALIALVAQLTVLRTIQDASPFSLIAVTILLSTIVGEALRLTFNNGLPMAFPRAVKDGPQAFLSIGPFTSLWLAATTVLVTAGLHLWLQRGRGGLALRAVGENREIAAIFGVRVPHVHRVAIVVGGALAGLAGVGLGLLFDFLTPTIDIPLLFKAIVLVLALGVTNVWGLLGGGIALGLLEASVTYLYRPSLRDAIGFWLIIIALLLRPAGLFKQAA